MKRTKVICFVLAISVILCACGGSKAETSLQDVKKAGKLVIATSPDFPPFEFLEGTTVTGIEIDVMTLVCEKLGVELVIEEIAFDSVLPGVQTGKYDCGASGITVTEERKENVLFSDVYYVAAQAIVVKADSAIKSKADLAGKKVSVQLGTTADDFCRSKGYTVDSYEANADAKEALKAGKVDAWVVDNATAKQMCKDDASVKILSETMTEEPYAFAFAFGSETLVEAINPIIADLIADGTMATIFMKYGEVYIAPKN